MSTEFNPGGAASLNAAVKARYEANPDTNALTDALVALIRTDEQFQDAVAAMFQGGTHTNITVAYNDAAGTFDLTAAGEGSGGVPLTQEQVEDFVAGFSVAGTGISVTYDDAANTLTIALTGESFTTLLKNKLHGIGSGDNLLMTAAERTRIAASLVPDASASGGAAISNIIALSRAQFDLIVPDATAIYIITDEGVIYLGPNILYDTSPATAPAQMTAPTFSDVSYETATVVRGAAPATGGLPITGYRMQYRPTSGGAWTEVDPFGATEALTGLDNDTEYEAQQRAVNAVGAAAWSSSGTFTTDQLPDILGNGGGTVDIVVDDGTFSVTVSGSSHAHQNGTFGPFATVDLDTGPVNVVAPVISGTAGTGEVLTAVPGLWVHEAGDVPTITGQWRRDASNISGETGSTYTTTAADDGADVDYQETATNTAGARSADSNDIAISVGATAPAQMSAPTVTATGSDSISVDRAAAPSDGGSPITSYDLRWSTDEATWTTVAGIADPESVTGLSASTLYYVQTRAVNGVGAGAWSASGSATTNAASGAMFTDTFSYTGNLEDQAGWTPVAGAGNSGAKPAANGSTASIPPGANAGWLLECQTSLSADQYSEITIGEAGDGAGNIFKLVVRMTDGDNYYYATIQNHNLKNLYKLVAGVQTQIGTTQSNQLVNGDVARLEVEGTTLRLKVNGSPVYTQTDSALSGGSAGLKFERIESTVTTTATLDSYSAGDL